MFELTWEFGMTKEYLIEYERKKEFFNMVYMKENEITVHCIAQW